MLLFRIISLLSHTPLPFSTTCAHKILPQNKEMYLWVSATGEEISIQGDKVIVTHRLIS